MGLEYLKELKDCRLCPWDCRVNRINGDRGVCRVGVPEVAYTGITPVLKTFAVTLLGCPLKCMYCNAYRISQYPDSGWIYRGYIEPNNLAQEAMETLKTPLAHKLGVNKLSFTGGEPSIHTPYLEEVVRNFREIQPDLEVGMATNGYCTPNTLNRIVKLSNYINFELKAYDTELHHALTGASSQPILENARFLALNHPEKIRVFRTVVIPGINDLEIPKIARFLKEIDPTLNYRLVGFRPHFMLYYHSGPTRDLMQNLVKKCKKLGLKNVDYSAYTPGEELGDNSLNRLETTYQLLYQVGCHLRPRKCGSCPQNMDCPAIIREPWTKLPKDI